MGINRSYLKTALAATGVMAAVAAMAGLGFWQLDRMQQKEQRLASIQSHASEQGVELDSLRGTGEQILDMPVHFIGRPDTTRLLYLDNRIEQGMVGYEVLVPVSYTGGWVLVNYGWVPASAERQTLTQVNISPGSQTYEGVVWVPQLNPLVEETAQAGAAFPLLIQQLDIPVLEELLHLSLVPFVVQLTEPQTSQFVRNWQPVVMPPEKHLAYAVQWFALAIAASIVAFLVVFSKRRKHD